jgi:serine/threonine-protein kinase
MASVYRAYEPALDRHVALKVLPREFLHDPTFAERFTREAKTIARLEHPNIIPIYAFDIDQQEGLPWMAMRLIAGGALSQRIRSERLPLERCIEILRGVAEALDYAHGKGVVHRDIKPQNILLDEDGRVYLADFGIAKILESSGGLTATGMITGTPQYMAPEQATGLRVERFADIYALGIVAYEMFAGQVPFTADTPVSVLMKHVQEPLPVGPLAAVPEALVAPLVRCTAKNPLERWNSAGDFVAALESALQPATAPQPVPSLAPATRPAQPPAVPTSGTRRAVQGTSPEPGPSPTRHSPVPVAESETPQQVPQPRRVEPPTAYAPAAYAPAPLPPVPAAPTASASHLGPILLIGVAAAALVFVLILAGGAYLLFTATPSPTPTPGAVASNEGGRAPTPDPFVADDGSAPLPSPTPEDAQADADDTQVIPSQPWQPPTAGPPTDGPRSRQDRDTRPDSRVATPGTVEPEPEPVPTPRRPPPTPFPTPAPDLATPASIPTPTPRPPTQPTPAPRPPEPVADPEISRLAAALGQGDPASRWRAAQALGSRRGEAAPAVPALVGALADRNSEVRWRCAEALGLIGPAAAGAVPALAGLLSDSDPLVRTEATKALGLIGAPAGSAASPLAQGLGSGDVSLRRESARALGRIGAGAAPAVSALVKAVSDKDKFVRMEAAKALGRIGPAAREAVPALTKAAGDSDLLVSREAKAALQAIGS